MYAIRSYYGLLAALLRNPGLETRQKNRDRSMIKLFLPAAIENLGYHTGPVSSFDGYRYQPETKPKCSFIDTESDKCPRLFPEDIRNENIGFPSGAETISNCWSTAVVFSRICWKAFWRRITSYNVCYTKLLRGADCPFTPKLPSLWRMTSSWWK